MQTPGPGEDRSLATGQGNSTPGLVAGEMIVHLDTHMMIGQREP